mgnify:CR=1 FL=1
MSEIIQQNVNFDDHKIENVRDVDVNLYQRRTIPNQKQAKETRKPIYSPTFGSDLWRQLMGVSIPPKTGMLQNFSQLKKLGNIILQ